MKIVVTGSSGYLGRHLVPELERRGHEVRGLKRWMGDLSEPGMASWLISRLAPELVVHLAGQPGREFAEVEPDKTIQQNVIMTAFVARACAEVGARLCHFSTSEVYGDSVTNVAASEWVHLKPKNTYGWTKLWSEQAARLYAPDDLVIIRPSMPYGPGQPVGHGRAALPTFIRNALDGKPIQVHRHSFRSWCYIDDATRGFADVIERGCPGIYNVGRDDDYRSMEQIAQLVCHITKASNDLIEIVNPPPTVSVHKNLSMTSLRNFGWKPEVSLEEGIARVMESMR